jgi:hypothetical protein
LNLRILTLAIALASAAGAYAQGTAASAPVASSPAKKQLVQKVLSLQQAGIDNMARALAQEPAEQLWQQAEMALRSNVPADKRDAVARDIQADLKKYVDETVPLVRDRATKLAPTVIGAMLEEKFSEDELKQLIAWMESPVSHKYQQMMPEMQQTLGEKLVRETKPAVEPKVRALQESIGKRLGLSPRPAAAPASAASGTPAKKK